jgi:hypothetical protein
MATRFKFFLVLNMIFSTIQRAFVLALCTIQIFGAYPVVQEYMERRSDFHLMKRAELSPRRAESMIESNQHNPSSGNFLSAFIYTRISLGIAFENAVSECGCSLWD